MTAENMKEPFYNCFCIAKLWFTSEVSIMPPFKMIRVSILNLNGPFHETAYHAHRGHLKRIIM